MPSACQLRSEIGGKDVNGKGSPNKVITWRKVQGQEEAVVGREGLQGARALGSAPNHRALSTLLPPPPGPERVHVGPHLPLARLPLPPPASPHASDTKQDKENS